MLQTELLAILKPPKGFQCCTRASQFAGNEAGDYSAKRLDKKAPNNTL